MTAQYTQVRRAAKPPASVKRAWDRLASSRLDVKTLSGNGSRETGGRRGRWVRASLTRSGRAVSIRYYRCGQTPPILERQQPSPRGSLCRRTAVRFRSDSAPGRNGLPKASVHFDLDQLHAGIRAIRSQRRPGPTMISARLPARPVTRLSFTCLLVSERVLRWSDRLCRVVGSARE